MNSHRHKEPILIANIRCRSEVVKVVPEVSVLVVQLLKMQIVIAADFGLECT